MLFIGTPSEAIFLGTLLTHLCRVDSSILTLWTGPFPVKGVSGKFLLLAWFTEISVLNANSVDADQTPRSAASDLGLHFFANVSFMGRHA